MLKEKCAICHGHKINYVDKGNGDVILFIHNGGGFWQIWTNQIEYFSASHRVVALDLPGFGESAESGEEYSLGFYHEVVIEFLKVMGIERVIFVGNCIGASIGIKLKIQYPEKISMLVLLNICPGERLIPMAIIRWLLFKTRSEYLKRMISRLLTFAFVKTPIGRPFPRILFGSSPDLTTSLYLKCVEKLKQPKQNRSRMKLLFSSNTFTLKHFLTDPSVTEDALLLWGESNRVASLEKEGYYHKELCGIKEINVIPGGGHLFMYEFPDITNQLIRKYLEN